MTTADAVVIGAGAAGLMCAISAARRGRRVIVLEHRSDVGAKILISGGGRCNFTNLDIRPECFHGRNPQFAISALSRFTNHDFIAMVEAHDIAYHEKTLGQLFCDGSARQIVAMLMRECSDASVRVETGCAVHEITKPDRFRIRTDRGAIEAPAIVVASGGLSIPKLGATAFAYEIASRFKIPILTPRPALVPMRADGAMLATCRELAGVSADAIVECAGVRFTEAVLFTHRGISGPAIIQISSYWSAGDSISINFAPAEDIPRLLRDRKRSRPKAALKTILGQVVPARLAEVLAGDSANIAIAQLSDAALTRVADHVARFEFRSAATEGWAKAEVTAGGIDTATLSSRTMESHAVPGLYFVGEAIDVTGWLGGYNFQWAWSSGWCAGESI